jgi:hypothetical protein
MGVMNRLILISPDRAWGFQPILSGKNQQLAVRNENLITYTYLWDGPEEPVFSGRALLAHPTRTIKIVSYLILIPK